MHNYDTVLKTLLQSPQNTIFERITGARVDHWLNVEFPAVQQIRVDLLGETADRQRLISLEFQSNNDRKMPLRMAEYALRTYRLYNRFPEQYVLFVGNDAMRMPDELAGPNFHCRFRLIDIRTLDEEVLLNSPFAADSIIAILTRHRDRRETIRRILARIGKLEGEARYIAFEKLTILAGLRKLGDNIRSEAKYMPILDSIMDHDLLGPAILEGIQEGLKKGRQEGRLEGRQEVAVAILRRQIGKRFGAIPTWADEHLSKLSPAELEALADRVIDAKTLEELLPR